MWRTIGQSNAIALLENGFLTGNLAHAYLFVGPPHVGKNTLALDLAQALNCEHTDPPCGECSPCRRILGGKHSDVIIIGSNSNHARSSTSTKARLEIGIEEIRELQREASLPPYEGKYKVFVIDGAECLSHEAANCLLKTLEEPPPKVVILLLAAEETRLLSTIISRCQRVELRQMPRREIERFLVESRGLGDSEASLLSRLSDGCIGWALMASVEDSNIQQRNQRLENLKPLLMADWDRRFSYAAEVENDRNAALEMIKAWLVWWRDIMLIKCDCKEFISNVDAVSTLEKWAQVLSLREIGNFIDTLQKSLNQISRNANLRLVFEVLMLDMPRKEE